MNAHLIAALIGNYLTTCFVIGLIVGAAQILRDPGHHSGTVISGRLLSAFLSGHRDGDLRVRGRRRPHLPDPREPRPCGEGLVLFMDIFIATIGFTLVIWHAVARRHDLVAAPAPVQEPAALETTIR
jgi:hypothetical protein